MSGGEIEFLTEEQVNNDPELSAEAHQKWSNEKQEIQEKFREFLVQVKAENIRNPSRGNILNAFADLMGDEDRETRITREFEKLSHQEKYQAVRDTHILTLMKETVIKQIDYEDRERREEAREREEEKERKENKGIEEWEAFEKLRDEEKYKIYTERHLRSGWTRDEQGNWNTDLFGTQIDKDKAWRDPYWEAQILKLIGKEKEEREFHNQKWERWLKVDQGLAEVRKLPRNERIERMTDEEKEAYTAAKESYKDKIGYLNREKLRRENPLPKPGSYKPELKKEVLTACLKSAGMAILATENKQKQLLICPINHELYEDPVFCPGDGYTYERETIEEWFKNKHESPISHKSFSPEQMKLVPNFAIRNACDLLRKDKNPENRSSEIPEIGEDTQFKKGFEFAAEKILQDINVDLYTFWLRFAEHLNSTHFALPDENIFFSRLYGELRLFRNQIDREESMLYGRRANLSWIMEHFENAPDRRCRYSQRFYPMPEYGGPVGISEDIRRTGIGMNGEYFIYRWWFEDAEARDAFHAQLSSSHPVVSGEVNIVNRSASPEPDDIGGRSN